MAEILSQEAAEQDSCEIRHT